MNIKRYKWFYTELLIVLQCIMVFRFGALCLDAISLYTASRKLSSADQLILDKSQTYMRLFLEHLSWMMVSEDGVEQIIRDKAMMILLTAV